MSTTSISTRRLSFMLVAALAVAIPQHDADAGGFKTSLRNKLTIGAIVAGSAIFSLFGVSSYNHLVADNQQVKTAWSNVDVELQRRADLIPNLVSVVKGYAKHEQETLTRVAEARAATQSASTVGSKMNAASTMTLSLQQVLLLQEKYPDLKASEQFQSLMRSLETTENRISVSRQRYNDATEAYNVHIQTFPRSLVANMASMETAPFFSMTPVQGGK